MNPEALDASCLRTLGHRHNHAIQQELLGALELDALFPEHARPLICDLFKQVHDHSIDRSNRIRSGTDKPQPSADNRSCAVTSSTRFRTALVPVTPLTPSTTPWAIFSVLPLAEWYAIRTLAADVLQ